MKLIWVMALCLSLLSLLSVPGEGASSGGDYQQLNRPSKKRKGKSLPTKGSLTTKGSHACSWDITGGEEEEEVTLRVSCSDQAGGSYWCQYAGSPQSCPTYSGKAAQYWKQVIGKVKRKKHACEGDATLKTRICKRGPAGSQLTRKDKNSEPGKRGDTAYYKKELANEAAQNSTVLGQVDSTQRVSKKGRKRSRASGSEKREKQGTLREMNNDNPQFEEDPSQAYCAEKWQSLCSFFVSLWNG
ncbi:fibroblast growth factor-binding protein 3-like [Mustelus asterias]